MGEIHVTVRTPTNGHKKMVQKALFDKGYCWPNETNDINFDEAGEVVAFNGKMVCRGGLKYHLPGGEGYTTKSSEGWGPLVDINEFFWKYLPMIERRRK